MALELLDNRNRSAAVVGTATIHLVGLAALLSIGSARSGLADAKPLSVIAVPLNQASAPPPPPPSPPPSRRNHLDAEAAPFSRGRTIAATPAEPSPAQTLVQTTPAETSIDPGTSQRSGSGASASSGAGHGIASTGASSGDGGTGRGINPVSGPVRIAGALTHEDYRRANPPRGAAGTVVVSFRVRTDGHVDQCQVLRTSNYPLFDDATCELIKQRFLFQPARDAEGRDVEWEVQTDFRWVPR
jgi:protein TonB